MSDLQPQCESAICNKNIYAFLKMFIKLGHCLVFIANQSFYDLVINLL